MIKLFNNIMRFTISLNSLHINGIIDYIIKQTPIAPGFILVNNSFNLIS